MEQSTRKHTGAALIRRPKGACDGPANDVDEEEDADEEDGADDDADNYGRRNNSSSSSPRANDLAARRGGGAESSLKQEPAAVCASRSSSAPQQRRSRTSFSSEQIDVLEHHYRIGTYPTPDTYERLTQLTKLDHTRLQVSTIGRPRDKLSSASRRFNRLINQATTNRSITQRA